MSQFHRKIKGQTIELRDRVDIPGGAILSINHDHPYLESSVVALDHDDSDAITAELSRLRAAAGPADIYDRMTDAQRRACVQWVTEQGRHLEDLEDWSNEVHYQTTTDTRVVYQANVLPHEDADARCNCGHSAHPDPAEAETYDLETREGEYARDVLTGVIDPKDFQ